MSVPQKKAAAVVYDDLGNPITTIMKLETTTPTTTHTTPEQKTSPISSTISSPTISDGLNVDTSITNILSSTQDDTPYPVLLNVEHTDIYPTHHYDDDSIPDDPKLSRTSISLIH